MLQDVQVNKNFLKKIQQQIKKHSPYPEKVNIIAVTKKFSKEAIISAEKNKLFNIGESKIQETEQKLFNIKTLSQTQIHLIGRLQSNKVKKAVKIYNTIHSVHKIQLLDKINYHAQKNNKQQQVFIQLKLNPNPTQIGFLKHEILLAAQHATTLPHINLIGVMVIGPQTKNQTKIKKSFDTTKKIQQHIYQKINKNCIGLSMGMSQDYVLALESGATHIRIGTKLFIKKNEQKTNIYN